MINPLAGFADRLADKLSTTIRVRVWREKGRVNQLPPDGDWNIWLIMAGRGFGKTFTGAGWIAEQAMTYPESAWAVFAPTYSDVRRVCVEGESGILRAALPGEIPEGGYNRSLGEITFVNGSKVYMISADQPERARGHNLWGAWCDELGCVPGSTEVRTENGAKPIRAVRVGERVWTRRGLRKVTWSGATRPDAELWEATTSAGTRLIATPDHLVWTENRGWIELRHTSPGDIIAPWTDSSMARRPGSNGIASAGIDFPEVPATTAMRPDYCCTEQSGNMSTGRSQMGCTSITLTMTHRTMGLTIYGRSRMANTIENTRPQRAPTLLQPTDEQQPKPCGRNAALTLSSVAVTNADKSTNALRPPGPGPIGSAVGGADSETVITGLRRLPYREQTYDLTVEDEHEFYANDVLVHNSWRRDETWYEGLVPAVRLGPAKIVVTTTPRPTKLVRDLATRKDGSVVITRGSTFDNAANLSKTAVAELRRRYEGTRLGRQELAGELLEDVEGALWNRQLIQYWPADKPRPDFERIVVAVDPSVTNTEDSDECGIIAAGRVGPDQYVVLKDRSDRLAAQEWGRRAVSCYHWQKADRIVGEVNNGGDLVESLIRSIEPEISYKAVRASRGKITRAEPVASLYEQGKVLHVEVFTDLEDQMCTYVPGDKSPDRVDALVWALTELSADDSLAQITWAGPAKSRPPHEVGHAHEPGGAEKPDQAVVITMDQFRPGGW